MRSLASKRLVVSGVGTLMSVMAWSEPSASTASRMPCGHSWTTTPCCNTGMLVAGRRGGATLPAGGGRNELPFHHQRQGTEFGVVCHHSAVEHRAARPQVHALTNGDVVDLHHAVFKQVGLRAS